ncbi:MAG: DUF2336 domain-containing protein [Alphaproteobacteria bacterium]|nr:DUF2336 domain-containing protein [Alphaproteobacteria bacterium]
MDTITGAEPSRMPIQALLGDAETLYALAKDKTSDARAQLSRKISSILENELTLRESEMVADVLIALIVQAEKDLRKTIAQQLSVMDNVPLRLILQLANDEIDVATPILEKSKVLSDYDLIFIIKSKPAAYWQAIAARHSMTDPVLNALAETRDFNTALVLAKNQNIHLTEEALTILSDLAQESDVLAVPLLKRDDVTADIAEKLYEFVGEEIKQYISENFFALDLTAVNEVVDRSVAEFKQPARATEFMPDDYMIKAAETFKSKGGLDVRLMIETLRRGHMRSFVAQLSVYADLPVHVIAEILTQTSGQGLAIIARAYDISRNDFISMFSLTCKIWNHGYLVSTEDIKSAIQYFEKITPDMAHEIIEKSH